MRLLGKNRSWEAFFSGFPTAPVSLKMCQNVPKCAKNAKNAPMYELLMKLHSQTEANLGFYIYFFPDLSIIRFRAYSLV